MRPGRIETIANIATIIVAVLLSVVLVKQFLLPPRRQASAAGLGVAKGTA